MSESQVPTKRILVVDDHDEVAHTLKYVLEELGCIVRLAHNGPIALNIAREFEPDLAFVDIGLPVMDGYELVRRMRSQSARSPRIIAVTGMRDDKYRQRSVDAGFEDHLVKPVDLAVLRRILGA